jgi:hypothetical protein
LSGREQHGAAKARAGLPRASPADRGTRKSVSWCPGDVVDDDEEEEEEDNDENEDMVMMMK